MTDQGSYHVSNFSASIQAEIRRLDAQVDLFWRSERELLREFGMRDGMDYLDCGSGPGRLIELVKNTYPSARCRGVEMDPILVEASNAKLRARGFNDCGVQQGTAENPGLPEQSVDFITMRLVLEHVPDPVEALQSLARLLRPGGRLFIISNDFEYHTRTWPDVPELAQLYDAYRRARRQDGGDPCIGRRVPQLFKLAGFRLIDQRVEVAHNGVIGDEAFLKAEGVGIPAELVSRGFLAQDVFESMIRNWKTMLEHPDHAITRQLNIAVGEKTALGMLVAAAEDTRPVATPAAAMDAATIREPSSDIEGQVAAVWARAMGRERISVDRNFFDLGGDSLMLQQVHAELRDLGFNVQVTTLFQYPTVETLAEFLSGRTGVSRPPVAPSGPVAGVVVTASSALPAGDDIEALARRRREALARRKPPGSS